ncbi:MAG: YdeI/OmpD-associated family protein [Saprospiraceae bacterium]|nr:YdeI/OmpD-associated family protein [Saprospiraceae bacterium]
MEAEIDQILSLATPGMPIWAYFPKHSSGVQTDLTRDKGWDKLFTNPDLRYLNLISFNDTWSAFSFRKKTDKDRKETAKPKAERAIFQYADSKTKTIMLPDDVLEILTLHPVEKARFDTLAFSHKREYIEWIIEAKRPETRQNRLQGLIERLGKG